MLIEITSFEFVSQDYVIVQVNVFRPQTSNIKSLETYELEYDPADFNGMSIQEMIDTIVAGVRKILAAKDNLDSILGKQVEVTGESNLRKAYA